MMGAAEATLRLRTLVVDDDHDNADTLGRLVAIGGDEVRIAYDGASALDAAREFEPNIGLIDLQMPQLDGFRLAKQLREIPKLHDMLLVAVTGFADKAHRVLAQEAGFDEYLVKPFSLARLRETLTVARELRIASLQLRADAEALREQNQALRDSFQSARENAHQTRERSRELARRHRRTELNTRLASVNWQPLVSVLAAHADCRADAADDCWCSGCITRWIHSVMAGEEVSDGVVIRLLSAMRELPH